MIDLRDDRGEYHCTPVFFDLCPTCSGLLQIDEFAHR